MSVATKEQVAEFVELFDEFVPAASVVRMSLRDWFAGHALAGMATVSEEFKRKHDGDPAKVCYAIADLMLAEREKEKKDGDPHLP